MTLTDTKADRYNVYAMAQVTDYLAVARCREGNRVATWDTDKGWVFSGLVDHDEAGLVSALLHDVDVDWRRALEDDEVEVTETVSPHEL